MTAEAGRLRQMQVSSEVALLRLAAAWPAPILGELPLRPRQSRARFNRAVRIAEQEARK